MPKLREVIGVKINTLLINHDIDTEKIPTQEVDFVIEQIKSKILELVPAEKMGDTDREDYTGNCDDDYDKGVSNGEQWGWNSFRTEILKRLEG